MESGLQDLAFRMYYFYGFCWTGPQCSQPICFSCPELSTLLMMLSMRFWFKYWQNFISQAWHLIYQLRMAMWLGPTSHGQRTIELFKSFLQIIANYAWMAHFSNCQNISRRRIAGKILFKGSELLWIVWIFNNLYCCRTWGRYKAWILRYIISSHKLSIMRMLMLFMTMPKSWWLCVHIWWRSTMPKDIRCQMHIAALQWESEQSMKRDCASGHTCDDIWASSQSVMMMTFDNDDDD